ncbi:DUF349 domain-containing protein [Allohahella marinimesophila]
MPSILSRLFKPRWQHADPVVRAEALSQLDWAREADRKILLQVLAEDSAEPVVKAGLARIEDPGVLLNFAGHADATISKAAEQHVIALQGEHLSALTDYFEQHFGQLDEGRQTRLLHLLLAHGKLGAQSQDLLRHAVACGQAPVARMAMEHPRGTVRQQAAALLTDIDLLEQTAEVLKRKDKGAYNIVRARIDEQKSKVEAVSHCLQGLSAIAHELEAMIQSESWYRLDERLPGLRKRFQNVVGAGPSNEPQVADMTRRVSDLLLQAESMVQRVDRKLALRETIEALEGTLEQLEASPPTSNQAPALAALISTQANRWANACEEAACDTPPADLLKSFEAAMRRLEEIQQSLTLAAQAAQAEAAQAEAEPEAVADADEPSPAKEEADATTAADIEQENALAELKNELASQKTGLADLLNAAARALEDGQSGLTAQYLKTFDERISTVELAASQAAGRDGSRLAKAASRSLDSERRALGQRLHELRQWASFATQPKQEALLAQAERLDDQSIAPKDKAQRMKALRAEWQALGHCPDRRLYGRFQSVMNSIQKSCSTYFEEEKRLRKLNQQKREDILAALRKLIVESSPDAVELSALETIVERSRQEWRTAFPVDRSAEKPLQASFDELMAKVEAPLIAAREAGKAGRLKLIEDVGALLESTSNAEVSQLTDAVKAAQARWKALPQTWRKDDRQLWQQFRALCDKSFERRDSAAAVQRDSMHRLEQTGNSRLDTLKDELSSLSARAAADDLSAADREALGQTLDETEAAIRAVRADRLTGMGTLAADTPGRSAAGGKSLDRKFDQRIESLLTQVREAKRQLESRKTNLAWRRLSEFATALCEAGPEHAEAGDLESRLNSSIDTVFGPARSEDWLDSAHILYEARRLIDELDSGAEATLLETSLRQAIVRAEIFTGVDTPQEDQPVRMSLQMQRLAEIGQRNRPLADTAYPHQRRSSTAPDGVPEALLIEFELGAAALLARQSLPDLEKAPSAKQLGELFRSRWQGLHVPG